MGPFPSGITPCDLRWTLHKLFGNPPAVEIMTTFLHWVRLSIENISIPVYLTTVGFLIIFSLSKI